MYLSIQARESSILVLKQYSSGWILYLSAAKHSRERVPGSYDGYFVTLTFFLLLALPTSSLLRDHGALFQVFQQYP